MCAWFPGAARLGHRFHAVAKGDSDDNNRQEAGLRQLLGRHLLQRRTALDLLMADNTSEVFLTAHVLG